jgi:hypothetical protein
MPEHVRAELVEGGVVIASPVRHTMHGAQNADLIYWATTYRASTPGVLGGTDATVRLDLDNELQPDVYLLIDPARGGNAKIAMKKVTSMARPSSSRRWPLAR